MADSRPPHVTPASTARERLPFLLVALLPLVGLAVALALRPARLNLAKVPHVSGTRPADGQIGVLPHAYVAADVHLPNVGHGIDAATLSEESVRLIETDSGRAVPATVNTSGAGDAIVLQPRDPLRPKTRYTFEVSSAVKDTTGAPFFTHASSFTTAAGRTEESYPVAFEKVQATPTEEVFTGLAFGPDRRLYAGTFDGKIVRFDVADDGTLIEPLVIESIIAANAGPRLVMGICFDPASTPEAPIAWVSHGEMALENATEWTGKISRLSGPDLGTYEDVVVGLPRSHRDHLNNQPVFGPDGAIYFTQASHTGSGAPDKKWNFRPERLLTAAVLRLDPRRLPATLPLDVRTDGAGRYDPLAIIAPLTLYATGVRVGFDLVWHSNGQLYVPVNGAARGGNAPASPDGRVPGIADVRTQDDFLLRVEEGGYYGHPNPTRREYVLNGGNPTAQRDPAEVEQYPVGTRPESQWGGVAYDFGKNISPNGVIEYRSGAFGDVLRGKLLISRYSGGDDVLVLALDKEGNVTETISGIAGLTRFTDPLDLVEDVATGNVYVAEFSGRRLSLLRPIPSGVSENVFREMVTRK